MDSGIHRLWLGIGSWIHWGELSGGGIVPEDLREPFLILAWCHSHGRRRLNIESCAVVVAFKSLTV